jgi:hypothetical protein
MLNGTEQKQDDQDESDEEEDENYGSDRNFSTEDEEEEDEEDYEIVGSGIKLYYVGFSHMSEVHLFLFNFMYRSLTQLNHKNLIWHFLTFFNIFLKDHEVDDWFVDPMADYLQQKQKENAVKQAKQHQLHADEILAQTLQEMGTFTLFNPFDRFI